MDAIKTVDLTKYYGKSKGIEKVSLNIKEGEIFGFVGPNGAGKSTTIRTLLGFLKPTSGSGTIFGRDIVKDTKEIKSQLGYLPSEVNFYNEMTVRQFVDYSASFYKGSDTKFRDEIIGMLEIDINKKIRDLSLGNKKKVGILQCVMHKPRLVILDEPTSGLDPLMQNRFFEIMQRLNNEGTTIFFSSHVLSEVQKLCSRVAIIKNGSIVKVEEIDEINQKNMKIIHVSFKDGVTLESLNSMKGVKAEEADRGFRLYVTGAVGNVLKELVSREISDITIAEPTLEELFMQYYV